MALMDVMALCLAPTLMFGGAATLHPNTAHTSDRDGVTMEAQTCTTGLGAHVFVLSSGFGAVGIQYGIPIPLPFRSTLIIQPFFGGSHTTRPTPELPQTTQFWTGANVMVRRSGWLVGAKWGHASNAGMTAPNIGLDLVTGFVGKEF